jgi:hypothetical protein
MHTHTRAQTRNHGCGYARALYPRLVRNSPQQKGPRGTVHSRPRAGTPVTGGPVPGLSVGTGSRIARAAPETGATGSRASPRVLPVPARARPGPGEARTLCVRSDVGSGCVRVCACPRFALARETVAVEANAARFVAKSVVAISQGLRFFSKACPPRPSLSRADPGPSQWGPGPSHQARAWNKLFF